MDSNATTYEQEIDLKDLLFAVLYKWRLILGATAVFALVLGAYCLLSAYRARAGSEEWTQERRQYEKSMEVYNSNLAIGRNNVQKLMADVEEQIRYLDRSVLMNMSPYDVWEAKTAFFIRTDYQILPDMTYQNIDYTDTILQSYALSLAEKDFLQQVADQLGIELRYLNELVTITSETNLLTLQVRYNSEDGARTVMKYLTDGVRGLQSQIAENVGEHVIMEVSSSLGSVVDLDLADTQKNQRTRLTQLNSELKTKQDELNDLRKPSGTANPLWKAFLNGIKFFAVAELVMLFLVCASLMMSDKLYSARQLENSCRLRVLGTLPLVSGRKGSAVDRWLNRLEGRVSPGGEEERYDLIAANVRNYAADMGTLLVTGAADPGAVSGVADRLGGRLSGIRLVACGSMLRDPEALKRLPECDGVLLVEQCGHSACGQVREEAEKSADLSKPVIGCVVFE